MDNCVTSLKIKNGTEVTEPNVSCFAALWVPTAGIVSPYKFTMALAENAVENDAKFLLETKVINLKNQKDCFNILCLTF